jgi:uncharacterized lipoprotein YmbA
MNPALLRASCLALLLCAACAGAPPTHYYVLELPGAATRAERPGLEIGVRVFEVDPPYDQQRIVYRIGEHGPEVGFYAYHQWALPLARMLPRAVAAGLGRAEGVGSIEPLRPDREYDAFLDGQVLAVEEIDEPRGQRVRLRMNLGLVTPDGEEIWSRRLVAEGETASREVRGVVEEMARALERALFEAVPGLSRALAARDATP